MSRAVNAVVIGVAVFVLLTGSIWYVMVAREPNRIKATTDREWSGADGDEFVAIVTFDNPYDYDIVYQSHSYRYVVNGKEWASGNATGPETLRPHTSLRMPIRVAIPTERLADWFEAHVADDEKTTVQLRGEARFTLSDRERTVPFGFRSTFTTRVLESVAEADLCSEARSVCFSGAQARWVQKDNSVVLQTDARLHNPSAERADLGNSSLRLVWSGIEVARADTAGGVIQPGEDLDTQFLVFFDGRRLIDWWARHTRDCEDSEADALLSLDVQYKPVEAIEEPTESPTPRTTATAPPPNTTSPTPSPTNDTGEPTPSNTSTPSPSPTPTNDTNQPSPTPTATNETQAAQQTQYWTARAQHQQPIRFDLERVRTAFACEHD